MYFAVAAQSRSKPQSSLLIVYWLLFAAQLVINKAVLNVYPHPNSVLLLQLATSCLMSFLCDGLYHGQIRRGKLTQKVNGAIPSAGSALVAVLACMHGFKQGVNVDTWVALDTCTPVAVAAVEALMFSKPAVKASHSILLFALAAAALSMHMVSISHTGLLCLLTGFVGSTSSIMHSFHQAKTTSMTSTERVFLNSLLDLLVCLGLVLVYDRPSLLAPIELSGPPCYLLALSCILAFWLSYITWEVQASSSNAMSYAVTSSMGNFISLIINYMVWDKHSGIIASWLTATAVRATMLWQRKQTDVKGNSKAQESLQDPTSHAAGILAVAAAVGGIALLSGTMGASVVRELNIDAVSNSSDLVQDTSWLHHESVSAQGRAVQRFWESADRFAAAAESLVVEVEHIAQINTSSAGPAATSSSSHGLEIASRIPVAAHSRAVSSSDYLNRLRAAAAQPINIVVMTGLFWSLDPHSTANCTVDGVPLDCRITQDQAGVDTADALYYHVPSFTGRPRPKAFPNQLRLAMSLESAAYYSSLNDPNYMCGFDAEMTYRQCAQVVNWYSLEGFKNLFATKPVPFEDKQHAVVYINSNCGTSSGRAEIMRHLMALNSSVPVHSLGRCDNNMPWPQGNPAKIDVQRRYKFCITMENSMSPDYVTEKLWDGLTAGCVPVYMGAASALHMIPDRQGIILYDPAGRGNASTPQELADLLEAIGNDKERYEAMMRWKYRKPEDQPNPLFKYLWSVQHTTGECFLCQFLARHRVDPKPRYTTCLFNSTWAAENGRQVVTATSSDGECPPA